MNKKKNVNRYRTVLGYLMVIGLLSLPLNVVGQESERPNVIIIITDDQGYGDLGVTGNPHVKTPTLDALAKESVRFNNFYVSPVCAPTRASLMTGRYSLRTGIRDTYNGGAIMAPSEVTIAEMLKTANYTTGIFGKWHLGDNYPSRPQDQGFDEVVMHLSGGMGQVGDFTTYFQGNRSYFDPVLWHNGTRQKYQGYCSDIFTEEAIRFIEKNKSGSFFCYLSFNAPHTPLQVPEQYYQLYSQVDPAAGFEDDPRPFVEMTEQDKEDARRVYAMVTNIDDNIEKIVQKLKDLNIEENTLIIFMTDNGPQQVRYVAGMKGRKGSVHNGGVRVPFYLKYPARLKGNSDIATAAAHIDVLPTLAEICGIEPTEDNQWDGRSLVPLMEEKGDWAPRPLFFYWTRKYPVRYRNMALQKEPYKLVAQTDFDASLNGFELYDIAQDPYEQNNLAVENTPLVKTYKDQMDALYQELIRSDNLLDPPRIFVGTDHENPIFLNRNDASGDRGIWAQDEVFGKWRIRLEQGQYNIRFKFTKPLKKGGKMMLETSALVNTMENKIEGADLIEMKNVSLPKMDCDLIPFYAIDGKRILPFWVEMERIQ
ncbi:arylsulfatase [Allomuricauda sp. SCSIO 65647]|uniref:arylsulfatase n=1 Tax=Allomuricauda sp. SCSIO 65647 TaxID=2908843 RepID=UPI001F2B8114|nr:arylsulfatase [Muricauda sp. SCSIO 65647]UJH68914.1 arylsulfatase [Muricauda sp. SCSIO 65647]